MLDSLLPCYIASVCGKNSCVSTKLPHVHPCVSMTYMLLAEIDNISFTCLFACTHKSAYIIIIELNIKECDFLNMISNVMNCLAVNDRLVIINYLLLLL